MAMATRNLREGFKASRASVRQFESHIESTKVGAVSTARHASGIFDLGTIAHSSSGSVNAEARNEC